MRWICSGEADALAELSDMPGHIARRQLVDSVPVCMRPPVRVAAMKRDAKILVMRRAPIMGRPGAAPRISVAFWAFGPLDAVASAAALLRRARSNGEQAAFWVEEAGQPARRTR